MMVRLFALALVSAALAVSGTVWLMTSGASRAGDAVQDVDLDTEIRAELYRYAREHQDWAGVAPLVRELAGRTGRRIALTGTGGAPIVDSAHGATDLPPAPAAVIDAAVPDVSPVAMSELVDRPVTGDVGFAYRGWRLSGTELRQRDALVDSATECFRGQATEPRQLHLSLFGGDAPDGVRPCVPPELLAPGAVNRSLSDDAVKATTACLDRRGLAYQVSVDDRGLSWVRPEVDTPKSADWTECERGARTAALRDYVAPAAELYLGDGPASPGGWRTAATVAVFLLVMVVGAVLVQRQLVRPLGELVAAARRLADGDRGGGVPVGGPREVTRVAVAFTAAAKSIGRADQRRKQRADDLAHELRRPLTSVRGYVEAAEAGLIPLDPAFLRSLHEETVLLERLVADVTQLGGPPEIRLTDHDAAALARKVVVMYRAAGVTVRLDAPDPVPVRADPTRLRQALDNVVANAVRHTPAGGTVTVAVRQHADQVAVAVSDTGSGVAAEHLPHVFDRSYRAEGPGGPGDGLGLAITRQLVEAQHGRVEITSTAGVGTTVTIRLPRSAAD